MRAIEIPKKGGPLTLVERPLPEPKRARCAVRVEACGICHSDSLAVEGLFPGVTLPLFPGHEIAGRIDALGEGVEGWTKASGSASAGSAVPATVASRAGAAT